jgi:dihydrofolate reductase
MAAAKRATVPGMRTVVFAHSLQQKEHPDVSEGHLTRLRELKGESGKDIWLFGGGALFGSLAGARMVDRVEVSIVPILLGSRVPLAPCPERIRLKLEGHKIHRSGNVSLEYAIA